MPAPDDSHPGPLFLPGDPSPAQEVARMIRVDHAGEYGARWIYQGQIAILGRGPAGPALRSMAEQEETHLDAFAVLLVQRRVRPSALLPLWRVTGWMLGVGTALLGAKAAMACTAAVETTIDAHYATQRNRLQAKNREPVLATLIETCRIEEVEHRETAQAAGANEAVAAPVLMALIRSGVRVAIRIAERL